MPPLVWKVDGVARLHCVGGNHGYVSKISRDYCIATAPTQEITYKCIRTAADRRSGTRIPSTVDCFDRDGSRVAVHSDTGSSVYGRALLPKIPVRGRATVPQILDCLDQTLKRPILVCKYGKAGVHNGPVSVSNL